MDADVELKVYGAGLDISIDFDKKKINIFDIQKYLSHHVFADSMEEILAYNEPAPMVLINYFIHFSKICRIHFCPSNIMKA